ncbi:MAG TPA: AmmeMemoRadiSam system protein B [bacterium]|nr:AmmeMemoRadiSam system protein B [bacterium]
MEYPKLRAVEAFPVEQEGQRLMCLRDPANMARDVVLLSPEAFNIVRMFDGSNSVVDIQAAYMRRTGSLLYSDKVKELVKRLDEAHMLQSASFELYKNGVEDEFIAAEVRRSFHAGRSYPADAEGVECMLSSVFLGEGGPGEIPKIGAGERLKGAVLPHIDLERGGRCYARGWHAAAAGCRARRFIVIGTGHFDLKLPLALTRKDFETPLGLVRTDKAFVDELAQKVGPRAFEGEISHRTEHSIEFQLLFIQYLFGPDIEVVPVLAIARQEPAWAERAFISPLAADFVSATRQLIDEAPGETFVVASADLAHVGPRFGDDMVVEITEESAELTKQKDLELLRLLEKPDIAAFANQVQSDGNARHICGFMPILLSAAITGGSFRLIDYSQAFDPMGTVTFASMVID